MLILSFVPCTMYINKMSLPVVKRLNRAVINIKFNIFCWFEFYDIIFFLFSRILVYAYKHDKTACILEVFDDIIQTNNLNFWNES